MSELKGNNRKNGKLSLYPLRVDEAIKAIVKVRPEIKVNASPRSIIRKGGQ